MSKIWYPEDCEPPEGKPYDPETKLIYELQAIPVIGRNPMAFHESILRAQSKHLSEAGVVSHRELLRLADENGMIHVDQLPKPKIKLMRPYRGQQSGFNGAMQWIPIDQDEPEPVRIQDPATMTVQEQDVLAERMRYLGYRINEPVEKPDTAEVTTLPHVPADAFDPGEHTVTEVVAYLRQCGDPTEVGRVLAVERTGQARSGILKRFKL